MNTQTGAINAASNLIDIMRQFENLSNAVDAYMKNYNKNTWDTYWSKLATVALAQDGSPAGTNDATPNNANPINLPQPNPLLVSRNDLINGIAVVQKFQSFMSQAGGTLTLSAQDNTTSAYRITG